MIRKKNIKVKYLKYYESAHEYYYKVSRSDIDTDKYKLFEVTSLKNIKKLLIDNKVKAFVKCRDVWKGNISINLENYLIDKNSYVTDIVAEKKSNIPGLAGLSKTKIVINQLEDEWYMIYLDIYVGPSKSYEDGKRTLEYYLCDQWDGLLILLKDKEII